MKEHLYSKRPNLVIGFHGCDKSVLEKVINGQDNLQKSENIYDWLGHGIYFWQNSKSRAMQYASEAQHRQYSKIKNPAVIGAIIDLGHCMDLTDSEYLSELKEGYRALKESNSAAGIELPENKKIGKAEDELLRNLDCAVIETVHTINKKTLANLKESEKLIFELAFTLKNIYTLDTAKLLDITIFNALKYNILENLNKILDSLDNTHIVNAKTKPVFNDVLSIMEGKEIDRYKTAEEKLLEMANDIICTSTLFSEYDSVRGVFFEGKQLYSGAGFSEKDHIQLCIKNPNCIKGFFLPREIDDSYPNP